MKLKRRLGIIASLVSKGKTVYDIGCDHALLDIFLTLYNENACYAVDVLESALSFARKNIHTYQLEDKINVVCSNGFDALEVKKGSVAVISGMGTSTILSILENPKVKELSEIILQPNNDYTLLRKELSKRNFKIVEEFVIQEKGIFYLTLKVVKGHVHYHKKDLLYGPILRKDDSIDTLLYFESRYLHNLELKKDAK